MRRTLAWMGLPFGLALCLGVQAQALPPVAADALPTGGQVASGTGRITQNGAAMVIEQQSQKMITNWQQFNVGRDASVTFQQPNSAAVSLNRVRSMDPSQIHGRIQANGQVFLINPNGVVFGKNAVIDAGGLVASSRDMADQDFLDGVMRFSGDSAGKIDHQGQIRTPDGGFVVLIGQQVRQSGRVEGGKNAHLGLVAANTVQLNVAGNELVGYRVEQGAVGALAENTGTMSTDGGTIVLSAHAFDALTTSVVNQAGVVRANGLSGQGGRVVLRADRVTLAAGSQTTATGSQKGGTVDIVAQQVDISGVVDVSGQQDGGRAWVWAQQTASLANASVRADGAAGRGGEISVASLGEVQIDASQLHAQGETQGGQIGVLVQPVAANFVATPGAVLPAERPSAELGLLDPAHPLNNPTSPPSAPSRLAILGSSSLVTNSRRGRGGGIVLAADEISLLDSTHLEATGSTGGGFVLVGGDWQGGANAERRVFDDPGAVYEATRVFMGADVVMDASATEHGDGGTVVLWSDVGNSDSVTTAHGSIFAKGGEEGGDGGQIETSGGRLDLGESVLVSTKSITGVDGVWLLDPFDLLIKDSSWTGSNYSQAGNTYSALEPNANAAPLVTDVYTTDTRGAGYANGVSVLRTDTIVNALAGGNVHVAASGWIRVTGWETRNDGSSEPQKAYINSTSANSLKIEAGDYIHLDSAKINLPNGTFELLAGSNITQGASAPIIANTLILGKSNVAGASDLTSVPTVNLTTASNYVANLQASNISTLSISNAQTLAINASGLSTIGAVSLNVTGDLNINGNITTNGASVSLKATRHIIQGNSVSIASGGGDITYWSNASETEGYIRIGSSVSVTSEGGNITMGGGSTDPLSGHATGTVGGAFTTGLDISSGATLNSAGGNITLRGQSSNFADTFNAGISILNSALNAGTGKVSLDGIALGSGNANAQAISIAATTTITSANTSSDAIRVVGNASSANAGTSLGVNIGGTTLAATGAGGGIIIEGTSGTGTVFDHAIDLGSVSLLSTSGPITVTANNAALSGTDNAHLNFWGGNVFGSQAGSSVTSSTANITLRADGLRVAGTNNFNSLGTVTIESVGSSFASAQTLSSGLVFSSALTGLTIGKPTNTANVTVANATAVDGAVNVNGGIVTLSAGITTTNATTGNITIHTSGLTGAGGISLAAGRELSITQSGASAYSGVIAGTTATLTKAGTGRLNLTAANTFTGGTTVSAGTLGLYSNTAAGTGDIAFANNTTLMLGRAVTEIANNMSLTGSVTVDLDTTVEYLIVGGGGGGGAHVGGGGGGGGVLIGTTDSLTSGDFGVVVGSGGIGARHFGGGNNNNVRLATSGGNSSLGSFVASGGGFGASWNWQTAGVGGSGGGGAFPTGSGGPGVGTPGQGNNGGQGAGSAANGYQTGGGGGAGGAGENYVLSPTPIKSGDGGIGVSSAIAGSELFYGGGGGGGLHTQTTSEVGLGGTGGGAQGSEATTTKAASGQPNTGGGGGGSGNTNALASEGGDGGSGLVIVRYLGDASGSGGTSTSGTGTATGYTLHSFTTTGAHVLTLNVLAPVLSGVISGPGHLALDATGGTVTLTGTNAYGQTTISGGTLKLGNAGTTGTLGAGSVTNNAVLAFNRIDDFTVDRDIFGTGSISKLQSNTVTLTGENSYDGTTTIGGGSLRLGNGTTAGSLDPQSNVSVASGASLVFNLPSNTTFANAISGAGAVSKVDSNTLTLTGAATYTGSTAITAGEIIFQNNAAPTTASFTGDGAVAIEPASNSFTSAITPNYTYASTLTGLRLGKSTNTANIALGSSISISGPISIYGGNITVNGSLNTSAAGLSGGVLLKASGNITQANAVDITTDGGDVIYWADSDQNDNGYIVFGSAGGQDIRTSGGDVIMAGGDGTTVPTGYAHGSNAASGINFPIETTKASINTAKTGSTAGDIVLRGRTSGSYDGIYTSNIQFFGYNLNFDGITENAANYGVRLGSSNVYNGSNLSQVIDVDNDLTITAVNTAAGYLGNALRTGSNPRVYADGNITINSSGKLSYTSNQTFLNINPGKTLSVNFDGTASFSTSLGDPNTGIQQGGLVINSYQSTGFTSAFDTADWTFNSNLSSLTIGNSANSATVTIGNAVAVAGPISIYGGNITVSQDLTSTRSGADILLKGSGNITLAASKSIMTSGGDVIAWANSGNVTSGTSSNGISVSAGSVISTSGGDIVLAGGADDGNGRPAGYAYLGASTAAAAGITLGNISTTGQSVVTLDSSVASGGGNILIRGETGGSGITAGIETQGNLKIDAGAGTITIDGKSSVSHGIDFGNGQNGSLATAIRSQSNEMTAISIQGNSSHSGSVGIFSWDGDNADSEVSRLLIQSEGTGGISIQGGNLTQAIEGVVLYTGGQILAASGPIIVAGSGTAWDLKLDGMVFGARKSATAVQGITPLASSSSNITLTGNNINLNTVASTEFLGTGGVVIQPRSSGFSAAFSTQYLSFGSNLTGLTIGKVSNTSNVVLSSAVTVAGPISVYGGAIDVNANLTATGGDILLDADLGVALATNDDGIYLGNNVEVKTITSGDINIYGRSGNNNTAELIGIQTSSSSPNKIISAGSIEMVGISEGSSTNATRGTWFHSTEIAAVGTINIAGRANPSNLYDVSFQNSTITTTNGSIIIKAQNQGVISFLNNTLSAGGGHDLVLHTNRLWTGATLAAGNVFLLPAYDSVNQLQTSFASPINVGLLSFQAGITGLTVGNTSNTANITLGASTIAGPITVYGGNIAVNGALTATNSDINLHATGAVTQTAAINAAGLGLHGTGSFTLTNTGNNIATLAGGNDTAKLGSLSYVNAGALTIGSVNPTGITATGDILVETLSGDLTVSENITTDSTTPTAIRLNADKSEAAGTDTGGNVLINGPPTFTTGTGGRVTFYTGSVSGSTGLTALVGSGSGRFRYNSDEDNDGYNTISRPLSSGLYALYRERPTVAASIGTYAITYGDTLPAIGSALSGAVNGDELVSGVGATIVGAQYSTTNNIVASATPYAITSSIGDFGYLVSGGGSGSLTVNPKAIAVSGTVTANSKVYDGGVAATLDVAGATLSGVIGNDVVSVATGVGSFADRHVGTNKTVTFSAATLTGADADNYSVSITGTATANITQLASATWVGGTGDWSNAANWAVTGNLSQTGVLPDGGNVGIAILPSTAGGVSGAAAFTGVVTGYDSGHQGKIQVLGGTLSVASDAHLGAVPGSAVADQITLAGGKLLATESFELNANRGINLGTGGGSIEVDSGKTLTYGGVIAGATGLSKTGAGTLTLTGENTYDGTTTIGGGSLRLGNGTTAGSLDPQSNVSVASGASLVFNLPSNTTFANAISGAGAVSKVDSTALTLTGATTYTGSTEITAGELIFQNNAVPTTSGFTGAGAVAIEPSGSSFTSAVTRNYAYASTLTGLRLGKSTNTANITLGSAITIAGPISVYGGNFTVNGNLNTSAGAAAGDVLLKASGDLDLALARSITTAGGNVVLWANSDGQTDGDGGIRLRHGSSISTAGGHIWLGGGSGSTTWNGLTVGDGYAVAGTRVLFHSDPSNGGLNAGVYMQGSSLLSDGGDIAIHGQTKSQGADWSRGFLSVGTNLIDSGTGTIEIQARGVGIDGAAGTGWNHRANDLEMNGVLTITSASTSANAIVWNSDSSAITGTDVYRVAGANLAGTVTLEATGGGGVSFRSVSPTGKNGIIMGYTTSQLGVLNLLATSGNVQLSTEDTTIRLEPASGTSITLGAKSGSTVTSSSSALKLVTDSLSAASAMTFNTSDSLTIEPFSTSFTADLNTSFLRYSNDLSSLTLGKAGNTRGITVGSATSVAGDVTTYSGNLAINSALTATGTINLHATGTVSQTAAITAAGLGLHGTGTFALTNTGNNIATLAGGNSTTKLGSLSYVNAGALTIGAVNPTGITATGAVSISTQTGNLTIGQPIATTNTGSSAIVLNAGRSASPGTGDGGEIIKNADVTAGAGGRIVYYMGTQAGSAAVAGLVTSGQGQVRFNADETTNFASANWTNLGSSGTYFIFRNQPTLTIQPDAQSIVYGQSVNAAGSSTVLTGLLFGDTQASAILTPASIAVAGAPNANGLRNAGQHTLVASGATSKLGYAIAYQDLANGLTVTPKTVGLSATKVYDTTTDLTGAVTITTGVGSETLTYTGAAANDSTVAGATFISAITLANGTNGGLASNYQLPALNVANAPATITRALVTVTANASSKFVTQADPTGYAGVSYSGFAGSEDESVLSTAPTVTRTLTGVTASDERAATYTNKLVAAGAVADNYQFTYVLGDFTIVPADTLVIEASGTSTYGTGVTYNVASAKYMSGSNVLYTLAAPTRSGNTFTFTDGSGDQTVLTLTAAGQVLSGSSNLAAGRYSLSATSVSSTSSNFSNVISVVGSHQVNALGLTVSASGLSKVYDATSDMVNLALSSSALAGDRISLSATAAYADKNVDANKAYVISNIAHAGHDAANYSLLTTSITGTDGAISARPLTVNYAGVNKPYDGSSTATVTTTDNRVAGDSFSIARTAHFQTSGANSKTVEANKAIAVTGVSLSGTDAANYALVATSGATTASITPKTLTISGITAADKVYDASTVATVSVAGVTAAVMQAGGMVAGDVVTITAPTGTFSDKNVGVGKTVSLTGVSYGGADLANYAVVDQTSTTATITPATITLAGLTTGVTKVYDAFDTLPAGTTGHGSLTGVLSSPANVQDAVTIVGVAKLDSANAGNRVIVQNTVALDGVDAANYVLAWTDGAATITKAPLTVTANNDARFVTEADAAGYSGVSYAGFINGETASGLVSLGQFTAPSIARSNSSVNTQGTYAGVLVPSAAAADNYAITYVNGDYTIVPANQLLVRVQDFTHTYGSPTDHVVVSARYLETDGTTIATLFENGVNGVGTLTQSGILDADISLTDGTGGSATFSLVPVAPATTASGNLAVGSYGLAAGSVVDGSGNFSSTITVVGTRTVTQRALTLTSAQTPTKVYDGTTSLAANTLNLGLTEKVSGDALTVAASNRSYANRNVGAGDKVYTLAGLALSGADAASYYLAGGSSQEFSNGEITPKAVNLSLATPTNPVTRVYSGGLDHAANASELTDLSAGLVSGDLVTAATIRYDTKNVGTGKTITPLAATIADGNGGANYTVTYAGNTASAITRLAEVQWTDAAGDSQWFNPQNWAGGAVPDLANVATVTLPASASVTFDPSQLSGLAEAGTVNLDAIQGELIGASHVSGALNQVAGTLDVSGDVSLTGYTQGAAGALSVGGDIAVVTSTGVSALGQHTVSGTTTIQAPGQTITLTNADNDFVGLMTLQGGTVSISDANALLLDLTASADATITSGDTTSLGTSTVSGNFVLNAGGAVTQTSANDTITVGGTTSITTTGDDITLANTGNQFGGQVTASGAGLTLKDASGLNAVVTATGNASLTTTAGDLTASLTVTGNSILSAGGDLTVSGTTDDLTGTAGGSISLGATTVGDDLVLSSDGDVSQTAALSVVGTSTLTSTSGAILLTQAGNDFGGSVAANAAGAVSLTDTNSLALGVVDSGSTVTVQAGPLTLGADITTTATSGQGITFTATEITQAAGVDIQASGANISLVSDEITFATGAGMISTAGDIEIAPAGAAFSAALDTTNVSIQGAPSSVRIGVLSNTAAILIGSPMTVSGPITLYAGDVSINAALTASNADINLYSNGAVTQSAALTAVTLGLNGTGDFTLANAGNNVATIRGGTSATKLGSLSFVDADALVLGTFNVGGNLAVTTGGALTDVGVLTIDGTTTIVANDGTNDQSVTLDTAANNFVGAVSVTGSNVILSDANALDLGASTISGNLTLTAGGAVTDSGALSVAGTTTIVANNGTNDQAVTLNTATNDFVGAVMLTAGDVTLVDANALTFGASTISGDLHVTTLGASGGVSQTAPIVVEGSATFVADTGTNQIANLSQANNFQGSVSFTEANSGTWATVGVTDADALEVSLAITGDASLEAGDNLLVAGSANDLTTTTTGTGTTTLGSTDIAGDLTIVSAGTTTFGVTTVGGALDVTSAGAVSQTGALTVTGTTSIDAAGHSVTLDNPANDFTLAVSVVAEDLTLVDANALDLGTSTIGGNLVLTTGGALTDSGPLTVTGTTTLTATGHDITLDDPDNTFSGAVSASARDLTLVSDDALELGTSALSGNLAVTSVGDVTQTAASSLSISGTSTIESATNVNLSSTANQFGGLVTVDAVDVALGAAAGPLNVATNALGSGGVTGTFTATLLDGDLSLDTNGSNITLGNIQVFDADASNDGQFSLVTDNANVDQAAGSTLTIFGDIDVDAGTAGVVDFSNAGNFFQDNVSVAAASASINSSSDLVMSVINVAGDLNLGSGSSISVGSATVIGGDLTLTAESDVIIDQADIQGGDLNLTSRSGNVVLGGPTTVTQAINIQAANDITFTGSITADAMVARTAAGSIAQAVNAPLVVASAADFTVSAGTLTLTDANNSFGDFISMSAPSASMAAASALRFAEITVPGELTLASGGQLNGEGMNLGLASIGTLNATAAAGSLNLGTLTIAQDMTLLASAGAITQTGPLLVEGKTVMTAAGAIDLRGPGNKLKKGVKAKGSPKRVQGDLSADQAVSTDKIISFERSLAPTTTGNTVVASAAPATNQVAIARVNGSANGAPAATGPAVATVMLTEAVVTPIEPRVIPVTVVGSEASAQAIGGGVEIQSNGGPNSLTVRSTDTAAVLMPATEVAIGDGLVSFTVVSSDGQSADFKGTIVDGKLVIVAPGGEAKQMIQFQKQSVIGAALAALQPATTLIAEISGIVLDMR